MTLKITATIQIQRPISTVFEALVDPDKMSSYFIGSSNGRMATGAELLWTFPEFDERYPVSVRQVVPNKEISFVWDPETVVTIALQEQADQSTLVTVTEGSKPVNEKNLKWFGGNSEGWANFLACLKAYTEYNINLRKGAFEFLRTRSDR